MTDAEMIREKIRLFTDRKQKCEERIVTLARAITPVLHDHNLHACAKPLDEALFEMDAIEQEMADLVKADPRQFFKALLGADI
jgi:hypothetical protein